MKMARPTSLPLALVAGLLLTGCANLAPPHTRPAAPVPAAFEGAPASATVAAADVPWQDFIVDARLRQVVAQALAHNRDLRVAAINIERAQAQYRIARSAVAPTLDAGLAASRQRSAARADAEPTTRTQYSVELGISSYELDFFGRVRNLSGSALQSFFAVQENRHVAQISLVAEVASAWLTLAADQERLRLAQDTLTSQRASYDLQRRSFELGGVSGLTLAQAQTTVDSARLEVARLTTQVALDRNALSLLVGGPLSPDLMPLPWQGTAAPASLLVAVPAGLPSDLLQRRPDVRAAEHALQAAQADIGAARAAFFPRITLTASGGKASTSLDGLFSGSTVWSFVPRISLPLFDGGANQANLQLAEAQQRIEVANYEKAIQVAFREVADAVAQRSTIAEQLDAQASLLQATEQTVRLSDALFKNGSSSYLDVLDAQRSLYAAQQAAIGLRLSEQVQRITLYKAMGGGWDPVEEGLPTRPSAMPSNQ
jgi:multidrug efflux system outer membrane protein